MIPSIVEPDRIRWPGAALFMAVLGASPVNASEPVSAAADPLTVYGDFRLRYEQNSSRGNVPSSSRGVLRGRLGATYRIDGMFELGARIATGDPDNPRTTDVTISDFGGDADVSLDQAFARFRQGGLLVTGGKFPKPFDSTELVWDGDVNPQGIAVRYDHRFGQDFSAQASTIYFAINEDVLTGDSTMQGVQAGISWRPATHWQLDARGGYYDYELGTLQPNAGARARGNNVAPDGVSLSSDFDLLDVIGAVSYSGFGDRWPVRLVGNYVHNLGAAVPEDTGYGIEAFVGQLAGRGDVQLQLGYMQAETDAVLGLFSHDNIPYATNYRLYALTVAYRWLEHTYVGLTNYRYRRADPIEPSSSGDGWANRVRLNLWFSF